MAPCPGGPHQARREELLVTSTRPPATRTGDRSYLLAYASHGLKDVFNVHALDLASVARAFGFAVPPRVDLNLSARGDKQQRRAKPGTGTDKRAASGHAFSAANPYGKKAAGDARQFAH